MPNACATLAIPTAIFDQVNNHDIIYLRRICLIFEIEDTIKIAYD